ncbi:endoplasmic reticulum membrane sensor NFE2L1b isoform X1 [Syngnathoides biaculeatus]|uniref:endoplasmic reticulum membrane sensor NFE2L1b isoform X1 n=1 Tax=Syngnathoides biaculeatus TaxID=300417 RepID=UPI002ADDA923|nr:endoplasmic reticulum membrane sensor NFE2L1b isoform X1 [Syngnathoides biaculeatus]XP_061665451.1 endoplasmic reticulum membrane sensor NFE2L1b isoform X1 [Syngnathoides biaculeatus]XP_061665452.1 endoplasmic reticulum membrane sensor NFE2L1b isoform X1 [Syngnathoides biaculeatus]
MLYLKKYFTEGLIQFTILLSLIGVQVDVDTYLTSQLPPLREIILGPSSAYTPAQFHNLRNTLDGYGIHPKSVDLDQFFATRRLLNRVRQLDRLFVPSPELDTWLVHRDAESGQAGGGTIALDNGGGLEDVNDLDAAPAMRGTGGGEGSPPETNYNLNVADSTLGAVASDADQRQDDNDDLSKEDIDLIDILWRQDIDLGAGREVFNYSSRQKDAEEDKLCPAQENKDTNEDLQQESWRNGVNLQTLRSVDIETGESIPQQQPAEGSQTSLSLQECLRLLEATFPFGEDPQFPAPAVAPEVAAHGAEAPSTSQGLAPQLDLEQQWQDIMAVMELQAMDMNNSDAGCGVDISRMLASDFGLVPPVAPIHQDVSLHQASLASCSQEFPPVFSSHLDSASVVRSSSSNSSHVNATFGTTNLTGLFLPPLLNTTGANVTAMPIPVDPFGGLLEESMLDEISLLDLAMEEGFSHAQASQLRDELDSDSGLSLDSSRSPASPSSSETSSSSSSSTSATFSEEGAVGYSTATSDSEEGAVGGYQPEYSKLCRMSFQDNFHGLPQLGGINHNHTYNLPLGSPFTEHPEIPKKQNPKNSKLPPPSSDLLDKHSSRDERRARAMKIPFSNEKIVNLPVEEFNELLAKHQLSEAQLALVRDIRRRGKNKMAAQNCRKRKLDTIINLEEGVHQLRRDKARLLKEKMEFLRSIRQMKQKMQSLCQEVFAQVRDEHGRPYPPSRYSLQYAADGSVLVVPRTEQNRPRPDKKPKDKKK